MSYSLQVFNPDYTITNGVYVGSFPLLKFDGTFTWQEDKSRLEFTFDKVRTRERERLQLTLIYCKEAGFEGVHKSFVFLQCRLQ